MNIQTETQNNSPSQIPQSSFNPSAKQNFSNSRTFFRSPKKALLFLLLLAVITIIGIGGYLLSLTKSPPNELPEPKAIVSPQLTPASLVINKETLIGIWHSCNMMPAGWCEHYNFYSSGKYRFFANSMDCSNRKIEESGYWSLNATTLKLEVKTETLLEGGRLILSSGSCSTEETLIEATPEKVFLTNPRVVEYELQVIKEPIKVGEAIIEPEDPYPGIFIGNKPFWKFSEDPLNYGEHDQFTEPSDI